jgi:hypothetical protein
MRFDAGVLGKLERTPTGGVRVPARVTREGVLVYQRGDGSVQREWRPATEVFRDDSLASLADCAVTIGHPASGSVTPSTFKDDAVGYVPQAGKKDGRFVAARLVVQDAGAIGRIDGEDLAELSCGYSCNLEMTSGTTPDGDRYDAIQRDISYNHVALLPRGGGRAGREVALRIDSAGAEIEGAAPAPHQPVVPPAVRVQRNDTMKKQRIDGIEYEVGSDAWFQACERRDARLAKELADLETRVKTAEGETSKEKARADTAEKRVKDLEAELTPTRLDARVAARTALVAQVTPVLGADAKLDGKTDLEIKKLALAKLCPEEKFDAKDEAYVVARFDGEIRHASKISPVHAARELAFGSGGGSPDALHVDSLDDGGPLDFSSKYRAPLLDD